MDITVPPYATRRLYQRTSGGRERSTPSPAAPGRLALPASTTGGRRCVGCLGTEVVAKVEATRIEGPLSMQTCKTTRCLGEGEVAGVNLGESRIACERQGRTEAARPTADRTGGTGFHGPPNSQLGAMHGVRARFDGYTADATHPDKGIRKGVGGLAISSPNAGLGETQHPGGCGGLCGWCGASERGDAERQGQHDRRDDKTYTHDQPPP